MKAGKLMPLLIIYEVVTAVTQPRNDFDSPPVHAKAWPPPSL